jgi:uncharacterized protein (TIGR03000 family)
MRPLVLPLVLVVLLQLGSNTTAFGQRHGGSSGFRSSSPPPVFHSPPVIHAPPVVHSPPAVHTAPVIIPAAGSSTGQVVPADHGARHIADAARLPAIGHHTHALTLSQTASQGTAVRRGFPRGDLLQPAWRRDHFLAWTIPPGWKAHHHWRRPHWSHLAGWLGWGAVAPIPYDYGTNIVYWGDDVCDEDDTVIASAGDYYQQALDLAERDAPDGANVEWEPLGVFALVQGAQTEPSAVFQLAISKQGALRGNYINILTDTSLPVHGNADRKSQRSAWTVGNNKKTVYETGMVNLTKDEAPLLIHFGKERTQQWLLVRLHEPEDNPAKNAPAKPSDRNLQPAPQVAHFEITLPENAELWFGPVQSQLSGGTRAFVTPPLQTGQRYYYDLRARWMENGAVVERTRRVYIRPGDNLRLSFE